MLRRICAGAVSCGRLNGGVDVDQGVVKGGKEGTVVGDDARGGFEDVGRTDGEERAGIRADGGGGGVGDDGVEDDEGTSMGVESRFGRSVAGTAGDEG